MKIHNFHLQDIFLLFQILILALCLAQTWAFHFCFDLLGYTFCVTVREILKIPKRLMNQYFEYTTANTQHMTCQQEKCDNETEKFYDHELGEM